MLGIVHVPEKAEQNRPVVVMCYGFNGNRVDNNRIAVTFGTRAAQNGIAVWRYDYMGLGISGGNFIDMTADTKKEDIKKVLSFLHGCMAGAEYKLYIIGFSDGIRMVSRLLQDGLEPEGIVLWSPIFYINAKYVEQKKRRRLIRDPESGKIAFPFSGLFVNPETIREQTSNFDDYGFICKSKASKLCVFGRDDPATLAVANEVMQSGSEVFDAEVHTIDEADHLYSRERWTDELIDTTICWILKNSATKES